MADEFKITKEIMEHADTYIPIMVKEVIAADMARVCIKETHTIMSFLQTESDESERAMSPYGLSPVYCESPSSKARVMMAILMSSYLHVWEDTTPFLCDIGEYDKWAGAHVLNQLERFKAGEYREKAFDLLADYREMERYLNSAIYSVLRELNDPVTRFMEALGAMSSAEGMQKAIESIQEAQEQVNAEIARQESIIHGEDESGKGEDNRGGEERVG